MTFSPFVLYILDEGDGQWELKLVNQKGLVRATLK